MKLKKILFLFLTVLFIFSCKENSKKDTDMASEKTTYYLIRHAEKNKSQKTNDPILLPMGKVRANYWADLLVDKNIDMIYSTDYKRTKQTAEPTAKKLGLKIKIYDAGNLYSEEFQETTKGKNVLIVGHQDTTPKFVNKIIGENKYPMIADDNNTDFYTVTIFPDGKIEHNLTRYNL
ncbi:SixA phosphatase family protein [Mesonia aquimarina]|uniref:SixA phosphatase family protein n=1 Tax=Mesonia aquimarina TaxID=1504967 RepID=UPI000EF617F3|nr:histidine phosphatase family protein [Mesonia aquimarina]